jgi:hypothetical protein
MNGHEWLRTLCNFSNEKLRQPFSVELDGKSWDCATNGHAMLFLEGATFPKRQEAPPADALAHAARRATTRYGVAPIPQLLDFCFADFGTCETCAGAGDIHDEEDGDRVCFACSGMGTVKRQGATVLGRYIDRLLLGKWLLPLRSSVPVVLVRVGGELEAVEFRCPDDRWRLFVMPMRPTLNEGDAVRPEAPVTEQEPQP